MTTLTAQIILTIPQNIATISGGGGSGLTRVFFKILKSMTLDAFDSILIYRGSRTTGFPLCYTRQQENRHNNKYNNFNNSANVQLHVKPHSSDLNWNEL